MKPISSPTVTSEAELQDEFSRRLAVIDGVFGPHLLEGRGTSADEITSYYEQSRWAYWLFHSSDGAMHLALNPDGVFDKDGFLGQAREVETLIGPDTEAVLELAAGRGFNLRYLAERHPQTSFTGVDLIPSHVAAANDKGEGLENLRFMVGDFQQLPFDADSFDTLFVVESLCHATDMDRALQEAYRVLRPGGLFVVVDGWRTANFAKLPADVQRAAAVTEQVMSVGRPWVIDDWFDVAVRSGFEVADDRDLTQQILPSVRRLERIARVILSRPRLARALQRILPERFLPNTVAAYLLQLTVAAGAHTYRLVALRG